MASSNHTDYPGFKVTIEFDQIDLNALAYTSCWALLDTLLNVSHFLPVGLNCCCLTYISILALFFFFFY